MSFREKSAWISLLAYLGIYGFYFANVGSALARSDADGASGYVLTIGVILLGVKDFAVINLLFFSLVASEVYKSANQIVLYRRGA